MLKERVITATVLALLFFAVVCGLPLKYFTPALFVLLAMAGWEWARLCGWTHRPYKGVYTALLLVLAAAAIATLFAGDGQLFLLGLLILSILFWLTAIVWILRYPDSAAVWGSPAVRALIGIFVLLPMFTSLVYLKHVSSNGLSIVLVVLIISIADIGAYFSGRRFGKRKLAVAVSPGKSWEGVWGGLLGNTLFAVALSLWLGLTLPNAILVVAVMLLTSIASVIGDLLESMIKRYCGVKDSGDILPGHGGILDRIDGWTAAMPVFTLSMLLANAWSL